MRLAGGAEVVLDAEVQLAAVLVDEPAAAADREHRRFGFLGHAEDADIEAAQHVLAAPRAGDLYVVNHIPESGTDLRVKQDGRTV
ncbi:hypothetical protein GCM10009661_16580 [Catellatospora chokoriensis]|uniref:Uncharacterized protein n=1 Tax=Catellatospora chokoriensis TaxID=310353 RepID=A0A8J3NNU9_9ACTN|nr:hypothetical protein Cch02nite_01400 [Catellatospora chokoriensis]